MLSLPGNADVIVSSGGAVEDREMVINTDRPPSMGSQFSFLHHSSLATIQSLKIL